MKRHLWCAPLLALSMTAGAQNHCNENDTRDTCIEKVQNFVNAQTASLSQDDQQRIRDVESKTAEAEAVAADAQKLLAGKNTGDASTSTINDFLPMLRALIETGELSGDGERIGFEWSNPLGLPARHQNKLTVALARSEMHQPLKDALRGAALSDQIAILEERIDEGDDISIGFSYAPASETSGRDADLHKKLFSSLLHLADIPSQAVRDARRRRLDLEEELELTDEQIEGPFTDIDKKRAEYIRLTEEEILAEFASMRELGKRLQKVGFYGLLDLVNNQPQLSVTVDYRARDEITGPDEFKAAVSYELGWHNVNTFREYARESGCEHTQIMCLASYLGQDDVIAGLRQSRRISVTAEYSRRKRLAFSLAEPAFAFSAEPSERFKLSAGFGRYLGKEMQGRTRPRLDAAISYEDYSDDPLRQNRGLATATLTYPVAEGFFLSIGAVYATKPEFRGDVDEELSARAGIVYKVIEDR